jgi:hypothetical protein
VEFPDETEASRREFIEAHKDRGERALRLRLLKPVKGELPSALLVARAEYHAARAKYHAARAKYQAAYRDNLAAIKALHKTECPDCPWNGETIFTRKDANGAWY